MNQHSAEQLKTHIREMLIFNRGRRSESAWMKETCLERRRRWAVQVPARQTLQHHLLPTCRVCRAITNSIKNVIKRFRSGAARKQQADAKNGGKEGERR